MIALHPGCPARVTRVLAIGVLSAGLAVRVEADGSAGQQSAPADPPAQPAVAFEDAQRMFYNGRYEDAAATTREGCQTQGDLGACELRTSALLFQIKRLIGDVGDKVADKNKAWKACGDCPALISAFLPDIAKGQAIARARLKSNPNDQATRFLLGKLDLNYVWLQLGTLGRKTGWGEYWEARRSLDEVLKKNPTHVRARVARAWIDYIVDTKLPRGARWLLGGGDKKRGLATVRAVAGGEAEFFDKTEAMFALWDMQVRERQFADAIVSARQLARDFPDNEELRRFLQRHDVGVPEID